MTLNTCCCGVGIGKGKNKKLRKEDVMTEWEKKKATNSENFKKLRKKGTEKFRNKQYQEKWVRQLSQYSDWLRAGRCGDRIPVGARFSAPVHTGPGANTAHCTMGTGSFSGVKSGRDVTLTPHPF
jgi:hypothetical protein